MANEFVVGEFIALKEDTKEKLALLAMLYEGKEIDGHGEIKLINPTVDELLPLIDEGLNVMVAEQERVIYFDEKAGRHFAVKADDIEW